MSLQPSVCVQAKNGFSHGYQDICYSGALCSTVATTESKTPLLTTRERARNRHALDGEGLTQYVERHWLQHSF